MRQLPLVLCLAALLLPLPACNIVAPAYLLVHGPEKVPPAYGLDKERPTVILVDVAPGLAVRPAVRAAIADQAGRDLLTVGAVTTMIDPRSAASMASLDRLGSPMPTSEIGRAVAADVVIHVLIESFTITPDGQTLAPVAQLRLKVIDAVAQTRLFPPPPEDEGAPVVLRRPLRTATLPERGAEWNQTELDFAQWVGTAVAQSFVEHDRAASHLVTRGTATN
jgi:hypothetical protein